MTDKRKYDLDSLNVSELTVLISEAEIKRREKIESAKIELVSELKERAASLGFTLEELLGQNFPSTINKARKPRKDSGIAPVIKYRGPNGEEWSGRGRPPSWINILESSGKSREDFLV